jgi:hypothetical protein
VQEFHLLPYYRYHSVWQRTYKAVQDYEKFPMYATEFCSWLLVERWQTL